MSSSLEFDPEAKERALRAESSSWDTSVRVEAETEDIPVVDVADYFASGSSDALNSVAKQVNQACETVGFFQLVGHGIDPAMLAGMFDATKRLHDLPLETKQQIQMDRESWPLGGVGYLPVLARKLPSRDRGNLNQAFVVKGREGLTFEDSQWLAEDELPGFRSTVEAYATAINALAVALVPIYAVALGMEKTFFEPAFEHPSWRLRMTHYPAEVAPSDDAGEFGIPPHVDTTFFTLLAQNAPGLTIYSHVRETWIKAPVLTDAFVVNSGELLKQWTNDRYLSVRHFANNDAEQERYSVPFFFNASGDYPMECVPTCCGPDNPAKYPTISYNQSQAVAQGE